jgi:hypothetical protein
MIRLIPLVLAASVFSIGVAAEDFVTKDGRQYMFDLKRRLQIESNTELENVFQDLRQNLPKQNTPAAMTSSLDAIAKMAAVACTYVGYFSQDWDDIDGLYRAILDRAPSAEERAAVIRDANGKPQYFPNCFMLALHPEFLRRK